MKKSDWVFEQYVKEISKPKLQPEDFYWDNNGLMVMTEAYHKKRGTCCGSMCKHCPYVPKGIKGNSNLE